MGVNKLSNVKLGFLFFVGLLVILALYYEWKSPDELVVEETEVSEEVDVDVSEEDINSLEEKYIEEKDSSDRENKEEIELSDLEKYQTVKGYDYDSFYKEEIGKVVYKEVVTFSEKFFKDVFNGSDLRGYEDNIDKEISNYFSGGSHKFENKVKSIDVFPIEPKHKKEISLGINITYSDDKSEFFNVFFEIKDDEYVLYDIHSEWSD